jgi:hypothetical protein
MIRELINDKLREKTWTFSEITNVSDIVKELAEYAYDKMTPKEKLDLVWQDEIHEPLPDYMFATFFNIIVMEKLKAEIAIIIKEELSDAMIVFKEDNKNEVSEGSVGGESHKERATDEENDSE